MNERERIEIKPNQAAVFTRPDGVSLYIHDDGEDGIWVHAHGPDGGPNPVVEYKRNASNEGWIKVRVGLRAEPTPTKTRR